MEQAGKDVVACLNEAMERLGLDMQVSALVCTVEASYTSKEAKFSSMSC